jgi:hypothetical protein
MGTESDSIPKKENIKSILKCVSLPELTNIRFPFLRFPPAIRFPQKKASIVPMMRRTRAGTV